MIINCKNCNTFLGSVECLVGEIICSNARCKAGNQIKVLTNQNLYDYKFTSEPKPAKKQVDKKPERKVTESNGK